MWCRLCIDSALQHGSGNSISDKGSVGCARLLLLMLRLGAGRQDPLSPAFATAARQLARACHDEAGTCDLTGYCFHQQLKRRMGSWPVHVMMRPAPAS